MIKVHQNKTNKVIMSVKIGSSYSNRLVEIEEKNLNIIKIEEPYKIIFSHKLDDICVIEKKKENPKLYKICLLSKTSSFKRIKIKHDDFKHTQDLMKAIENHKNLLHDSRKEIKIRLSKVNTNTKRLSDGVLALDKSLLPPQSMRSRLITDTSKGIAIKEDLMKLIDKYNISTSDVFNFSILNSILSEKFNVYEYNSNEIVIMTSKVELVNKLLMITDEQEHLCHKYKQLVALKSYRDHLVLVLILFSLILLTFGLIIACFDYKLSIAVVSIYVLILVLCVYFRKMTISSLVQFNPYFSTEENRTTHQFIIKSTSCIEENYLRVLDQILDLEFRHKICNDSLDVQKNSQGEDKTDVSTYTFIYTKNKANVTKYSKVGIYTKVYQEHNRVIITEADNGTEILNVYQIETNSSQTKTKVDLYTIVRNEQAKFTKSIVKSHKNFFKLLKFKRLQRLLKLPKRKEFFHGLSEEEDTNLKLDNLITNVDGSKNLMADSTLITQITNKGRNLLNELSDALGSKSYTMDQAHLDYVINTVILSQNFLRISEDNPEGKILCKEYSHLNKIFRSSTTLDIPATFIYDYLNISTNRPTFNNHIKEIVKLKDNIIYRTDEFTSLPMVCDYVLIEQSKIQEINVEQFYIISSYSLDSDKNLPISEYKRAHIKTTGYYIQQLPNSSKLVYWISGEVTSDPIINKRILKSSLDHLIVLKDKLTKEYDLIKEKRT